MTQLAVERARPVTFSSPKKGHSPSTKVPFAVALHPLTVLGLAVTLGLATGLVELAMHFVRRQFINSSSLGALQLNSQAYWMVPVSDSFIFGTCGLLVAAVAAPRPFPQGFRSRRLRAFFPLGILRVVDIPGTHLARVCHVCRWPRISTHRASSGSTRQGCAAGTILSTNCRGSGGLGLMLGSRPREA